MSNKTPEQLAQDERIFPTRWTSTQPDQNSKGYMIKASDLKPPMHPMGQRVTGYVQTEEGRKEVSVPHLYYEKWIDDAGNIRTPAMRSTRAMENGMPIDTENNYHRQMTRDFYAAGWLHFERGNGQETKEAWLARRDSVIAERRSQQAVAMEAVEKRHMDGKRARNAEMQEALTASFETIAANMAARVERAASAKKGG
jgi:hypothetical protein